MCVAAGVTIGKNDPIHWISMAAPSSSGKVTIRFDAPASIMTDPRELTTVRPVVAVYDQTNFWRQIVGSPPQIIGVVGGPIVLSNHPWKF